MVRAFSAHAEVEHIPQDGDLALRACVLAKGCQRRSGADWICIVGVVDQRDARRRGVNLEAHRRDLVDRQAALDLFYRDAQFPRRGDCRGGVCEVVFARGVELECV